MKIFFRALSVENLKLKRTLTAWMVLVAPLAVNLMVFFVMLENGDKIQSPDPKAWVVYMTNALTMWSVLMLPLLITLESALLGSSEHANQQWKHLFALPVPRWSLYAAKWTLLFELILASSALNMLLAVASGLVSGIIFPLSGLTWATIPWGELAWMNARAFAAGTLILSIHTWISLRWPSLVLSIGVGMVAVVCNLFVMRSDRWSPVFPWTLPISSFAMENAPMGQIFAIALLGGLLVGALGGWDFSRRDPA